MRKQIGLLGLILLLLNLCVSAGKKIPFQEVDKSRQSAIVLKTADTVFINWAGNVNTSWATPGNWSGGNVPTENDDVLIPSGTPYSLNIPNAVTGNCNSIKISSGATVTVASGGFLNIKSAKPLPGTLALTTAAAAQVTSSSALLGGTITNNGGCAIIQHGIAMSVNTNPTINQTTYQDISLSDTGTFSIPVISLMPATTYYVRAYAINCLDTSYGNEISFTTNTGTGGGTDSGYFRLTTSGVTYFSYDLLSPLAATVFPEGDTRFAYVTWDFSNQVFNIAANSNFLLNPAESFGFDFGYTNPDVHATGTFTFAKAVPVNKALTITIRTGPGAPDATQSNYSSYLNTGNFSRAMSNNDCKQTEITSLVNTLIITRWGNPGEYIEGTVNGTLYENVKTGINCSNSTPKPFSVEFKLKRLQ